MDERMKLTRMKTIDLSTLTIKWVDGTTRTVEFGRELAQVIFENTRDVGEHAFSIKLYENPVVEKTDENARIIRDYTGRHFKAFVQVAVNELLDESEAGNDKSKNHGEKGETKVR